MTLTLPLLQLLMTNESQQSREARMFTLGMEKLQSKEAEAREKGYATSGPLVASAAWSRTRQYAMTLKREHLRILELKQPRQEEIAFESVMAEYALIDEEEWTSLDQTVKYNGKIYPVEVGYFIAAATVWRTVADTAFTPGTGTPRSELKTRIGQTLELVIEYFKTKQVKRVLEGMVESNPDEELQWLVKHLNRMESLIGDSGATLGSRMGRAKGLISELRDGSLIDKKRERGLLLVKRGPQVGTQIRIPEQAYGKLHQKWEDPIREMAADSTLNLLVRGKDSTISAEEDQRPFTYSDDRGDTDRVRVRQCFEDDLQDIKEKLSGTVVMNLPLLEVPQDWVANDQTIGVKNHSGGYHTDAVRVLHPVIRSDNLDCETVPGHLTMALLNKLQQTEWRLDPGQLEIVRYLAMEWHEDYDGIVRPLPYTVDEIKQGTGQAATLDLVKFRDTNRELIRAIKRKVQKGTKLTDEEKQHILQCNENDVQLKMLYRKASQAERLVKSNTASLSRFNELERDTFYYAWNCDSRLRVYPIGGVVTPQGPAMERHTLEFAKGEYLNEEGEKAALRAIGTAAIDSKVSPLEREMWGRDHLEEIRFLAEGTPAALAAAAGYDAPLQLIQLCRHWVQHEQGGLWRAPIYADATNSGWGIVGGLLNDSGARKATNIWTATEADTPADAYKLALNHTVHWLETNDEMLLEGKERKPMAKEDREILLKYISGENASLGRACSKAYACTKIYGSSMWTQVDDIKGLLFEKNVFIDDKLLQRFTRLIEKAYRCVMNKVFRYNRLFKELCQERLLTGVDESIAARFLMLDTMRSNTKRESFGKSDLSNKERNELMKLSARVYHESEHRLSFSLNGDTVDLIQLMETVERFQTPYHGRPSYFCRHAETIDLTDTLQACPPALIHYLDGTILKVALAGNKEYEVSAIHDSVGCLPNHFEDLLASYRQGYQQTVRPGLLSGIAREWGNTRIADRFQGLEDQESKDWMNDVDSFYLMFN